MINYVGDSKSLLVDLFYCPLQRSGPKGHAVLFHLVWGLNPGDVAMLFSFL